MYQFKKGAAAVLAGVLSISSVVPAFAYTPSDTENYDHVTTAGNVGNAAVTLTVEDREEPVIFSAYVPAELPIAIDANGDVIVPENAKIINGVGNLPIGVEAIDVTMEDGWTLAAMDTDMSLEAKDTKKVAMEVLGQDLSDADSFNPAKIEANSDIALNMKANLPDQSASSQTKIATIGFTVNWWEDEDAPELNATHLVSASKMRSALQELTGSIVFSTEAYDPEQHPGMATDISEAGNGSVMAVVNDQDAVVYSEGGTLAPEGCALLFAATKYSNNLPVSGEYKATSMDLRGLDIKNTTDISNMFNGCIHLQSLDVSTWDTSNVTNMEATFHYCTALRSLDLTNFDTSNVTNLWCTFKYMTNLETVDLSSFDTDKVTKIGMTFMFDPNLKTVYCHTQEDAKKLKTNSDASSSVQFIVKF